MGNDFPNFPSNSGLIIPQNCKLHSSLPIDSSIDEQHMKDILTKRQKIAECPYICTIKGYDFVNEQSNVIMCSQAKKLVVFYDNFDYRLIDIPIKNYAKQFTSKQICNLIHCIVQAMHFLKTHKLHHGDISLQNICKKGKNWRLIDKMFIRNGINAYEKVLEGEPGFISPKQMIRIRYGYIKESPDLLESDDIFSLGMVVLQLASGVASSLCYKQMNIRFNEEILKENLSLVAKQHPREFHALVQRMINMEEDERITLNQLRMHPLIQENRNSLANLSTGNSISFKNKTNSKQNLAYTKSNVNLSRASMVEQKPFTPATSFITHETTKIYSPPAPQTPRTQAGNAKGLQQKYQINNNYVINSDIYQQPLSSSFIKPQSPFPNQTVLFQSNAKKRTIDFNPHRLKTTI